MIANERATGTVLADQAIFSSIRSPMGEGYRIVAASKGITQDERREILQYAPSHGSLSNSSEDARALAYFPLSTGRRCLFLTRAAGLEHTGRGGYRVFTHILVLDPAALLAFDWDPFAAAAAVCEYGDEQVKRPPDVLTPLEIRTNGGPGLNGRYREPRGAEVEKVLRIVSGMLCEQSMLITGASDAAAVMRQAVGALPAFARRRLSACHGLKFSPARKFALQFTDADPIELRKIERDSALAVYKWNERWPTEESPFQGWLRYTADRWESGREPELREIAAGLIGECAPVFLERIADLIHDTERIRHADGELVQELEKRHAEEAGAIELHRKLLEEFRGAVERRRRELERNEAPAATICRDCVR